VLPPSFAILNLEANDTAGLVLSTRSIRVTRFTLFDIRNSIFSQRSMLDAISAALIMSSSNVEILFIHS
jgi:hypothetical protein